MIYRNSVLLVMSVIAATALSYPHINKPPKTSKCHAGQQVCCNSLESSDSPEVVKLLSSLGLNAAQELLISIECTFTIAFNS
jgi:hypothetical protein